MKITKKQKSILEMRFLRNQLEVERLSEKLLECLLKEDSYENEKQIHEILSQLVVGAYLKAVVDKSVKKS